jgi:hypothetical protein
MHDAGVRYKETGNKKQQKLKDTDNESDESLRICI